MTVVKVDAGGEVFICGTGEEVHAPVAAQQPVPQLRQGADCVVDENVIVSPAAGEGHQLCELVGALSGIDVHQSNAPSGGQRLGNQPPGPGDALLREVRHHNHGGLFLQSHGVLDGLQPHGAAAPQNEDAAPLPDAHNMLVAVAGGVVVPPVSPHHTAHGLAQAGLEIALSAVVEKAAQLHHLRRDHAVSTRPSEVGIGVPGGGQASLVVQGGLLGEFLAGREFAQPLLPHLHNVSGELVADDDGVCIHIRGTALVGLALDQQLVGGHADAVAHDPDQNLIVPDVRQIELLQADVIGAVETHTL